MNGVVFRQSFGAGHVGLALYAVGVLVVLASGTLGYEAIAQQGKALSNLLRSLPPALMAGFQLSMESFSSPLGYISARSLSLLWPIVMVAFAAGAGASVAALIERGTLHYELNLPISRVSWLSSRSAAALLGALALVGLTGLALALRLGVNTWSFIALGGAFTLFWLGVSFLLASLLRDRGPVFSLTFGLFALEFFLTTLGRSLEGASWLEHFSVWSLYNPENTLRHGPDGLALAVLAGGGLLLFALAARVWRGRDFPA